MAACFRDARDPRYVEHALPELLRQRVTAIALGYEDLNDHAALRRDPLLALAAGKHEPLGPARAGAALAAPATLQRLETTVDHAASRDHKIVPLTGRLEACLLQQAVRTLSRWQREVILDLDATHDPLHGRQEGRFFHGYNTTATVTCRCMASSATRSAGPTADRDGADGALAALQRIVAAVRRRCRKPRIILRADSGFCRAELLAWCEAHGVDHLVGLARNARLTAQMEPALARAREQAILCGGTARVYTDFAYRTLDSWSRARRVLGKAERLGDKDNPRFVVTTLVGEPGALYEQVYCARGEMENRVKEQQTDLFGERLSCHGFASNQLRLWLAAFAYVLMSGCVRSRGAARRWRGRRRAPSGCDCSSWRRGWKSRCGACGSGWRVRHRCRRSSRRSGVNCLRCPADGHCDSPHRAAHGLRACHGVPAGRHTGSSWPRRAPRRTATVASRHADGFAADARAQNDPPAKVCERCGLRRPISYHSRILCWLGPSPSVDGIRQGIECCLRNNVFENAESIFNSIKSAIRR